MYLGRLGRRAVSGVWPDLALRAVVRRLQPGASPSSQPVPPRLVYKSVYRPTRTGPAGPLIGRLATGNRGWGYQRIQGELLKPGHRAGAPAIRRIPKALRIPPAPARRTDMTWRQFLHGHAASMPAADFFQVDSAVTLRRRYCLVVIEVGSRHVHIPGVSAHPDRPRATQQIRNLLTDPGERAAAFRFLVRDRAGQFTASSDPALAGAGIEAARIPPRSPRANADAERFVLTTRTEVTGPILILGERHLRSVLADHARHYNRRRPHRSRAPRRPRPDDPSLTTPRQRIRRQPVPGSHQRI